MAHHVDESPSSAMLGEGVLMVLTFGDAHLVLDVRVSEKLLEFITRTFVCTMGVEDAKALRALSLC